jgi:hypothetical protein
VKAISRFSKVTSLAVLMATLTVFNASRAEATGTGRVPATSAPQTEVPNPVTISFGGVGVGRGQTVSIIVVCLPDPSTREEPLELEFTFQDLEGNVLGSSTQTLIPGRGTSFDTRGIIAIRTERVRVIPTVTIRGITSSDILDRICCNLEVFDNTTGKTQFLVCRKAGGTQENF